MRDFSRNKGMRSLLGRSKKWVWVFQKVSDAKVPVEHRYALTVLILNRMLNGGLDKRIWRCMSSKFQEKNWIQLQGPYNTIWEIFLSNPKAVRKFYDLVKKSTLDEYERYITKNMGG